jgi:hypothetical protein
MYDDTPSPASHLFNLFLAQGHIEDNEEYNDIADVIDGYDEEEDSIGEINDSEKEGAVNALVDTIFCDGERILGEVMGVLGDEEQVNQHRRSPQVEGMQLQYLSMVYSLCYQRSSMNWQASKLKTLSLKDFPVLKVGSISNDSVSVDPKFIILSGITKAGLNILSVKSASLISEGNNGGNFHNGWF